MRIRTIKPDFFFHDGLFALERETSLPVRVAYIGLWCAADREGRFPWEPMRLGAQILPYDGVNFSRVMDALKSRGFIVEYTSGSRVFGVIPSFKIHQIVNNKERDSVIPEPPPSLILSGVDAKATREDRDEDACRKEGKGTEQKGTDNRELLFSDEDQEESLQTGDLAKRLGALFGRKQSTKWSAKEVKALKALGKVPEEDIVLIEARYAKEGKTEEQLQYLRQDLCTLLNNFQSEIDRQRNPKPKAPSPQTNDIRRLF